MPPRSSLTSSFSVTDANNEVVCPLRNQDGSSCRKRCIGEKRYRSMQEHIRRAHPEHYISKLPATEESFQLMINTPPSERPAPQPSSNNPPTSYGHERYSHDYYGDDSSAPNTPRNLDEYTSSSMLPAVSAAATLAQLHNHKVESDWDSEIEWMSDTEAHTKAMRSSIELPPISRPNIREPTSEPFPSFTSNGLHPSPASNRQRDVYHNQSHISSSPPGRSSTLPPLQRHSSGTRPRKQSVSKRAKEPAHRRQKSREQNSREQHSREQMHMRRMSYDRKAFSAEPSSNLGIGYGNLGSLAQQAVYGKRWEDLIDAATSATEDVEEERTPIPQSPQIPQSPMNRNSLPPFSASHFQGYQASPLQRALTPPDYNEGYPADPYVPASFPSVDTLPSVESTESAEGGNFHMDSRGLSSSGGVGMAHSLSSHGQSSHGPSNSTSSYALSDAARRISDSQNMSDSTNPNRLSGLSENSTFSTSGTISGQNIQIYCAACQGICLLKESYACTECICGICRICVDVLVGNPAAGNLGKTRGCPRCETVGGRYKRFALEFR